MRLQPIYIGRYPGEWVERAACRGRDDVEFFPPLTGTPGRRKDSWAKEALALCRRCDPEVRSACLAFAKRYGEVGVWGGTTEAQRRSGALHREG